MSLRIEDGKFVVKIILAGDGAVGKTTLVNRLISGGFTSGYQATIGVDISSKEIPDFGTIELWDIAGQALFSKFRKRLYLGSQGCFLVFDLTTPKSYDSLYSWIDEIQENVGNIPIVLLGNKVDIGKIYSVPSEDIEFFLKQHPNIESYFPTSAITGINVKKALDKMISIISRNIT